MNIRHSLLLLPFFVTFLLTSARAGKVGEQRIKKYPFSNLIRTVCSLDSSDNTYISWNGTVYNVEPGKEQEVLFLVSGFNVARCYQVDELGGLWFKSSREMMLYLDPETGEVIDTWINPNRIEVPVVHVANSPATQPLGRGEPVDVLVGGEFSTFVVSVPLFYPNPAYFNPATRPFAPYESYQATELFQWIVQTKDLAEDDEEDEGEGRGKGRGKKGGHKGATKKKSSIDDVTVAWTRSAPYLPWMNMTDHDGHMLLTATATRVNAFDDLFNVLKTTILERAPIYETAPDCVLGNPAFGQQPGARPWASETSWSYFVKNFDAYLDGALFPLYEEADSLPCIEDVLGQ